MLSTQAYAQDTTESGLYNPLGYAQAAAEMIAEDGGAPIGLRSAAGIAALGDVAVDVAGKTYDHMVGKTTGPEYASNLGATLIATQIQVNLTQAAVAGGCVIGALVCGSTIVAAIVVNTFVGEQLQGLLSFTLKSAGEALFELIVEAQKQQAEYDRLYRQIDERPPDNVGAKEELARAGSGLYSRPPVELNTQRGTPCLDWYQGLVATTCGDGSYGAQSQGRRPTTRGGNCGGAVCWENLR